MESWGWGRSVCFSSCSGQALPFDVWVIHERCSVWPQQVTSLVIKVMFIMEEHVCLYNRFTAPSAGGWGWGTGYRPWVLSLAQGPVQGDPN